MSDLKKLGLIFALIAGIVSLVRGILSIMNQGVDELGFATVNVGGDHITKGIIAIIIGIILIFIYTKRIDISDNVILGVVILVLGILGGGIFAIIGGILILVDEFV